MELQGKRELRSARWHLRKSGDAPVKRQFVGMLSALCLVSCGISDTDSSTCSPTNVGEYYESRVEPLLQAEVSTCSQCHLTGVGLANYVRQDACHTMACMIELGEVNLQDPSASPILARVGQAAPDSELITTSVIEAEYLGLFEWITFSAQCHESACGQLVDPCAGNADLAPSRVNGSPTGLCDISDLTEQFDKKVLAWKGRCGACHSSGATTNGAPGWLDLESAERTLFNVLGRSMVDIAEPSRSTILTKPLSTADPLGIAHGGGNKFADRSDPTYQDIRQWVEYFAACHTGTPQQLPEVTITSPVSDSAWNSGTEVLFEGQAVDPQDGLIDDERLQWLVNEVPAGTGRQIVTVPPDGYIRIALSATDSDGNVGTRSLSIFMGGDCRGAADTTRVSDEGLFFDTINSCLSCGTSATCMRTCLAAYFSADCADCVSSYALCQREHCAVECGSEGDECGRCISLHCGESWKDCSGIPEPF